MSYSQFLHCPESETLFTINGYTAQLCCSEESKEIAYGLRYRAYTDAKVIEENDAQLFSDDFDLLPNSRTHLIWYEGQPIASVRSCIWSEKYDWSAVESVHYFAKDIDQRIGLDKNILESSRYVVAPEIKGRASLYAQLLLFRAQDLSSQVDDCSYILTAVRERHVPFYKRMLAFEQISPAIKHSYIDLNIVLLMTTQEESRRIVTDKGMPPCERQEVEKYGELIHQLNNA